MKEEFSMFLLSKQQAVFAESDCPVHRKLVPMREMKVFERVFLIIIFFFYFVRHLHSLSDSKPHRTDGNALA
jgi:hypothetical protein